MSFQGQKNVYLCKCGHGFVTVDRDEGVTPFMTTCQRPGCGQQATSLCYKIPQQRLAAVRPVLEWYRPSAEELAKEAEAMRLAAFERTGNPEVAASIKASLVEHVNRGGLLQRAHSGKLIAST